ncbi:hypothetical protein QSX70_000354 [Vibrio metoecus]
MPENTQDKQHQIEFDNAQKLLRFELFCTTRLEADKSLLALSSAGVGLIVTLLTGDNLASIYELLLFLFGAISFGACILTVLAIFNGNATYIQSSNSDGRMLAILDKVARYSFFIGIALTSLAAVLVSVNNLTSNLKEQMTDEPRQIESKQTNRKDLCEGQLGGCKLDTSANTPPKNTKPTSRQNPTNEAERQIEKDEIMAKDEMKDISNVEIRKSWEGANNILDTPPKDSESNSSGSGSGSGSSNTDTSDTSASE